MSLNQGLMQNYVDLVKIKVEKNLNNRKPDMVLNDDIWGDSTLLVKSGRYLTESLINKLLNFGVKEVNVNFVKNDEEIIQNPDEIEFIRSQCALILENNLLNTAWLVRNLVDMGFKEKNIFITAEPNYINRYFRIKKINFIIAGFSLYEQCLRSINKYSLLRNTHAFVIMGKNDSLRKIKNDYNSDVKFLRQPLNPNIFSFHVNAALNDNLLNSYQEEVGIS